jgi:MFS family permease
MPTSPSANSTSGRAALVAWIAWLAAATFFFYAWVLRVSPSILVDELMRELGAGGAVVGQLSALYFYAYAGAQLPVGVVLDRFGARIPLTAAVLVCSAATVLFAASGSMLGISGGRFLIGLGAAFSLVGAIHIASQSLPAKKFAMLSGLAMMAGMIGGVVGQGPMRILIDANGWRPTYLVVAALGVLLALVVWLSVPDEKQSSDRTRPMLVGLWGVLREPQNWLNSIAGLGATGPLLGFGALWGVPYLQQLLTVSPAEAAGLASLTLAGWGVGAPFFGWISDRSGRRRGPMLTGVVLSFIALSVLLHTSVESPLFAGLLSFAIGFGGSAQIVTFAFARGHNLPANTATAYGFLNGIVVGAGALFQPAIGFVLDARSARTSTGDVSVGVSTYSVDDYRWALSLLLVGLVVSAVVACFLREPRSPQEC